MRFEHMCGNTGVEEALRELKEVSGKARSDWILLGSQSDRAQLSYLGRALPVGNQDACTKARVQHRTDLRVEHTTGNGNLKAAKEFAKRWAKIFLMNKNRLAKPDLPTLSGCMEMTSRKGGLRKFAVDLGMHEEALKLWQTETGLPPQDIQSLVEDLSLLHHGRDLTKDTSKLVSDVVVLAERGLKTRVITKSPAGLHFLGHVVRKRLLAGLRLDSSSASPLLGLQDEEIINHFRGARAEVCVSTDLTRASDLLPLDLVKAIADGLEESGKLTSAEIDALRLCSKSQLVNSHLPHSPTEVFDSKRGILMGLPTTWALLSLIHIFWWSEAIRRVARRRRISKKKAFDANRFLVCGDDGLFLGSREVSDEYLKIVGDCGGVSSPGKHFICDSTKMRAVFLERLFDIGIEDGEVVSMARNSSVPLRGLVRPDVPKNISDSGGSRVFVAPHLKMLLAVDSAWSANPGGAERLLQFVERRHSSLFRVARELGLPTGIPMSQGGSGIPSRRLTDAARMRRAQSLLLFSEGKKTVPKLIQGIVDPLWQLSDEMSEMDVGFFMTDGTIVLADPETEIESLSKEGEDGYVDCGPAHAFGTARVLDTFRSMALMQEPTSTRTRLSESRLRRGVKLWESTLPPLTAAEVSQIELTPPVPQSVFVRRTRGPDGKLLYPRWAGDYRASEALSRATLARKFVVRQTFTPGSLGS